MVLSREDGLAEKTLSNMQQVKARGGEVILVTDALVQRGLASWPNTFSRFQPGPLWADRARGTGADPCL